MDTLLVNVFRVRMFHSEGGPSMEVTYNRDPITQEQRKKNISGGGEWHLWSEMCWKALHAGKGDVYLFPWGWSYWTDQRTE